MRLKRTFVLLSLIILSAILIIGYRTTKPVAAPILQSGTTTGSPATHATTSSVVASQASTAAVEVIETISENISDRFAVVASTYAEEISYPPYSTPLRASDSQLLQPNAYHAQIVPLENGASASIQLERFRFIYPEPIGVQLILDGIQVYEVSLRLYSELTGKLLTTSKMQTDMKGYHATLSAESDWDGPLRIEIEFKSGGHSQIVQTGFEYSQPVARIVGLGTTYTDATDLLIPVKLAVTVAGQYRLRANLFTSERQPLAVLSESAKLTKGDTELTLRVYKTILKGSPAPLRLSTFQLENRSAAPGEPTRYGDSEQPEFLVNYSGTELFSTEEYKPGDEETQRLEFLKQMGEKK